MFPGADADPAEAAYVVVGAPLDATATFEPGARFGPREVRHYAEAFDDYDPLTDVHFSSLSVADHGDVAPTDDVAEYLTYLAGVLGDYADDGATPLLVGGEHTVAVAALRALDPDVFVCCDAHLDLYEAYAGNPLSHATVTYHALDHADHAVIVGARTASEREWERASEADVTVLAPEEVPGWEPDLAGRRAYLSIDVDAVDPGFAPATGTREPFGLDPPAVRDVVRAVAPHAVGADVVEITDDDLGQTAALGAKLLREFVYARAAADSP
jgi:agmatinase